MREIEEINIKFSGLLTTLLTVLFVGLKLTNYIDWSWWWVLTPLWMTFDLLDLGYRIFLHRNNKVLECKPGMDGTEKDIRYEHNIFRLIRAKHFDNYFNEKPYLDNSEFDYGHNVKHKINYEEE